MPERAGFLHVIMAAWVSAMTRKDMHCDRAGKVETP